MRVIDPARIRSKVYVQDGIEPEEPTVLYAVYVDDALYLLFIVSDRLFLDHLGLAELDIFNGYSRYARAFNARNGLPERKT